MKSYLTQQETADLFQVAYQTCGGWLRRGRLKGFKMGGKWFIPQSEIDKLLHPNNLEYLTEQIAKRLILSANLSLKNPETEQKEPVQNKEYDQISLL